MAVIDSSASEAFGSEFDSVGRLKRPDERFGGRKEAREVLASLVVLPPRRVLLASSKFDLQKLITRKRTELS